MFLKYLPEDIPVLSIAHVGGGILRRVPHNIKDRAASGFVYVLSGEAIYTIGKRTFHVYPDDVFYLAEGECYQIDVLTDDYDHIHIDFHLPEETQPAFSSDVCIKNARNLCLHDFEKLYSVYRDKEPMYLFSCRTLLYRIFKVILGDPRGYISAKQYAMVQKAVSYLENNYNNPELSVEDAARHVGHSAGYLRRMFHMFYGITVVRYLQNFRADRAKELLLSSDMKISDIAQNCGFSSLYYFSESFRALTGLSPTRFREIGNR